LPLLGVVHVFIYNYFQTKHFFFVFTFDRSLIKGWKEKPKVWTVDFDTLCISIKNVWALVKFQFSLQTSLLVSLWFKEKGLGIFPSLLIFIHFSNSILHPHFTLLSPNFRFLFDMPSRCGSYAFWKFEVSIETTTNTQKCIKF